MHRLCSHAPQTLVVQATVTGKAAGAAGAASDPDHGRLCTGVGSQDHRLDHLGHEEEKEPEEEVGSGHVRGLLHVVAVVTVQGHGRGPHEEVEEEEEEEQGDCHPLGEIGGGDLVLDPDLRHADHAGELNEKVRWVAVAVAVVVVVLLVLLVLVIEGRYYDN